jgi:hypothetical protein
VKTRFHDPGIANIPIVSAFSLSRLFSRSVSVGSSSRSDALWGDFQPINSPFPSPFPSGAPPLSLLLGTPGDRPFTLLGCLSLPSGGTTYLSRGGPEVPSRTPAWVWSRGLVRTFFRWLFLLRVPPVVWPTPLVTPRRRVSAPTGRAIKLLSSRGGGLPLPLPLPLSGGRWRAPPFRFPYLGG